MGGAPWRGAANFAAIGWESKRVGRAALDSIFGIFVGPGWVEYARRTEDLCGKVF